MTDLVLHACPICGNQSPAGKETNHVCDVCWRGASVTFSMSTAGPESMAEFGATMDVARLSAATARVLMQKLLRRERMTRAWQSIQWFAFASSLMVRRARIPVLTAWATKAQERKAIEAGGITHLL